MKPIIKLKNIKVLESLSEETHCFTAVLYVDGKKFADVSNHGHGGNDDVHPFNKDYQKVVDLENKIKRTYPKIESEFLEGGMDNSLEIICCNMINDWLIMRDFKKLMKRVCYVKPNEIDIYQLPSKFKPSPETIQAIKAKASWAKKVIFLADISEDEAFQIFKNN